MNANDFVIINPDMGLDQNTSLNGVPTLGDFIGHLEQMTLRSGTTYPTPRLAGGDLTAMQKVIAITLISTILTGTALYATYVSYSSAMCATYTTPHLTGAMAGVDLGCSVARQALISAMKKMSAFGLIAIFTTYGVAKKVYLTQTGISNIDRIMAFLTNAVTGRLTLDQIREGPTDLVHDNPAVAHSVVGQIPASEQPEVKVLQKEDQRAGSSRRRPNYKKQRRSRQKKNSGRKQYRKSRQLY